MIQRIGWRAIARYLAGESTANEATAVETWVRGNPQHAEIFESARRAWDSAETGANPFDVDRAWDTLSARLAEADANDSLPRAGRVTRWRGRVLWASGLLAAGVAFVLLLPATSHKRANEPRFVTNANTVITAHLADGSVVRVAPNSVLRLGAAGAREAWLDGKAFFAISKQNGAPFVVHTARGDARVLGTRFELRTTTDEVRLVVLEGRVALTAHGRREIVPAGQVSFAIRDQAPTPPKRMDVQLYTDWLSGVLIFQATPLREVAREIETTYHVAVRLDSTLAERTVSGMFDHQPLQTVAAAVCRVADATCQVTDTAVTIHQ